MAPRATTYRCFLSDLTGFIVLRRIGPNLQHHLAQVVPPDKGLKQEFNPAIADFGFRAPLAPRLARPQQNANPYPLLCQANDTQNRKPGMHSQALYNQLPKGNLLLGFGQNSLKHLCVIGMSFSQHLP